MPKTIRSLSMLLAILTLPLLAACSSAEENRRLDEKLGQTPLETPQELDRRARDITQNTPGLTDAQRTRLDDLRQSTHDKLAALSSESLRLRSLLVKDTLREKPDRKEIAQLKARLKKVSKERLDTVFGAADQANEILGRDKLVRRAMDLQFIEDDLNYY
jgi:hypothetical protein